MKRRNDDVCPDCFTDRGAIATALYLCADREEAMRILNFVRQSIIVKIAANKYPQRLYIDGTLAPRRDIAMDKRLTRDESEVGAFWYSANGLRFTACKIAWGSFGAERGER